MATHKASVHTRVGNFQPYRDRNTKSVEILSEYGKEFASESQKRVELEILEADLAELINLLHIAERPTVKQVIHMDIERILTKLETLKDIAKEQFETKVSWSKVVAMKHKKYNHKEQKIAHNHLVTSNQYHILCNDSNDDDPPLGKERISVTNPKYIRRDKIKHKKMVLERKQHKVLIVGDSHARGCAASVKNLLNNNFEVFGSINPGSGMKGIMDTARVKLQKLTKKDVVVLWGGSNDIAKNNSPVGIKHVVDFLTKANHTNVILMSAPHRHDLISDSCVNKEVDVFNKKLHKRAERFEKVVMIDVVSDRNSYTRQGQHLNSTGKEHMAKKITTVIEYLCNKKEELISGKWYKEAEIKNPEHQDIQEVMGSNLEEEKREWNNAREISDTEEGQSADKKCEGVKRPRRQPVTRNQDFLWPQVNKN